MSKKLKLLVFVQSLCLAVMAGWSVDEFLANEYLQSYLGGFFRGWIIISSVFVGLFTLATVTTVYVIRLPTRGVLPSEQGFSGETHNAPGIGRPEAEPLAAGGEPSVPTTPTLPVPGDTITVPKDSPLANFIHDKGKQYRHVDIERPPGPVSRLRQRIRSRREGPNNRGP